MRVKLKYPDVDTFLAKYGPNISRGGIFIATKAPKPIGTMIRFEFILVSEGAERAVLRGEGAVNFVREADPNAAGRGAGMGVRFTKLFDDGQALVDRALRMRGSQAEPPPPPDLPRGVREVTGEVELHTGPVPRLDEGPDDPLPPPRPLPAGAAPQAEEASEAEAAATAATVEAVPQADALPAVPADVTQPYEIPPQADAAPSADLDELAREAGVSTERVAAVLGRRGRRGVATSDSAAELEALLSRGAAEQPPSPTEAAQRLDDLLARRRR